MKVLMLQGSPDKDGVIATGMKELAKFFEKEGIETKIVDVGLASIRGCIACKKCHTTYRCVFDDLVNETKEDFKECDGLIVGSPVYYGNPNATLIAFLTRLFYSSRDIDKRMKVGASIVSARRNGCASVFDELNKFFTISQMPIVSSSYWNDLHGYTKEDCLNDEEGIETLENLAKNMAFLIKSIKLGQEKFGMPNTKKTKVTNFFK